MNNIKLTVNKFYWPTLARYARPRRHARCALTSQAAYQSDFSHAERGARFEQETVETLRRSHFHLTQTGGASDGGIDFKGSWQLVRAGSDTQKRSDNVAFSAPPVRNIPVIGQCKNTASPVGVEVVRDFEGATTAFLAATHGGRSLSDDSAVSSEDVLGIIVSASSFSKNARRHSSLSGHPQLLVSLGEHCELQHDNNVEDCLDIQNPNESDFHIRGRRVIAALPNRAFLRAFPFVGFTLVDETNNGSFGVADQPAFWFGHGNLVLM
eukprot:INCI1379.2.p1 GENE.INCI1379.2~~INCI1379.2.p1  ORF type:complete len:267 (+),score=38.66 INCI1379.2:349-1149(+)